MSVRETIPTIDKVTLDGMSAAGGRQKMPDVKFGDMMKGSAPNTHSPSVTLTKHKVTERDDTHVKTKEAPKITQAELERSKAKDTTHKPVKEATEAELEADDANILDELEEVASMLDGVVAEEVLGDDEGDAIATALAGQTSQEPRALVSDIEVEAVLDDEISAAVFTDTDEATELPVGEVGSVTGEANVGDDVATLTGDMDITSAAKEPVVSEMRDTVTVQELVSEAIGEEVDAADIDAEAVITDEAASVATQKTADVPDAGVAAAVTVAEPVVTSMHPTVKSEKLDRSTEASVQVGAAVSAENDAGMDIDAHTQDGSKQHGQNLGQDADADLPLTLKTLESAETQGYKFASEMREIMQPTFNNVVLGSVHTNADSSLRVYEFALQGDISPDVTTTLEQVTVAVKAATTEGHNNFTIQLAPKSLGFIEVQMEVVGDRITSIKMLCNRPETRDVLMKEAGMLLHDVSKVMNAEDASLSFDLRSNDQHAQHEHSADAEHQQTVAAPKASSSYEAGGSATDEGGIHADGSVNLRV